MSGQLVSRLVRCAKCGHRKPDADFRRDADRSWRTCIACRSHARKWKRERVPSTMRRCKCCKGTKPLTEFRSEHMAELAARCAKCRASRSKSASERWATRKPSDALMLLTTCNAGHVLAYGYEPITGYATESCPCGTRRTRRGLPAQLNSECAA